MPLLALCAVSPTVAFSLRGGAPTCSSRPQIIRDWWATGRSITTSVSGTGLLLRRPWGTSNASLHDAMSSAGIAEKTSQHADLLPIEVNWRNALLSGKNQKQWVVQSYNSEQGPEISEDKSVQSSEEKKGPPVLTIIAGLLVLLVVFWALGSLVSWIVGLFLK